MTHSSNSTEEKNILQDPKILVLLKDYDLINIKIEQFISKQPNMFGAGIIAILGIIGLYANGYESNVVLEEGRIIEINHFLAIMALPFFTLFYMCIIGYHYMRTLTLQGYKRVLEKQINTYLGKNCLNFSMVGMVIEKDNSFRFSFIAGFIILLLFSILVPVLFIKHYCGHISPTQMKIFYFSIIAYIIFLILAIIAGTQIGKIFNKSVEMTEKEFAKSDKSEE